MRREPAVATSPARTKGVVGAEGQARLGGVHCLPRILVADAGPVQGTPSTPELHAGRVRGGVEVAENDRWPLGCVPLDRQSGTPGLLLTLDLEGKWPVRLVVSCDEAAERRLKFHDQGCTPGQVGSVLGGALVDLLQDPVRGAGGQHSANAVLTNGGERRDAVPRPEQFLDFVGSDFLQRNYVGAQLM